MEQNQQHPAASRSHRSSQQILECLKEQHQGGLTVKEYCLANAISQKTFYRWQKVYGKQRRKRGKKQSKARSGFTTIDVIGSVVASTRPQLFAENGSTEFFIASLPEEKDKSLAAPSLKAHVTTEKFMWHTPIHRNAEVCLEWDHLIRKHYW